MRIETDVTRLLGIDLPIVQAGMSWASSHSALPLAVSNAGGLGQVAAGPMRPDDLRRTLQEMRAGTDRPWAVNMPIYRKGAEEVFDLLAEMPPPVLVASQGSPAAYLERFRALGTVCIHIVGSIRHAEKAAEAGVDALVVVGGEAGGHPPPALTSTLVAVRAVRAALPEMPLIASGGFADGHGLAAALALGAGAAAFGTRYIATPEANVHAGYKARIVEAGLADSRTVGRGLGLIRVIRNEFSDAMEALEASGAGEEERRTAFGRATLKHAAHEGDMAGGKVEAGQSAALVTGLVPAAELTAAIAEEYVRCLDALPRPEEVGRTRTAGTTAPGR